MFNTEQFLNQTTEQAGSTKLDPVPEGEYQAISEPLSAESFRTFEYKSGDRAGQKGIALDVQFRINDPSAGDYDGRKVRWSQNLDVTPDGHGIDFGKGKNIGLGRLREAFGQNKDGQPWSPSMLGNQVAKIKVTQRMDKDDSTKIYNDIKDVASL